MKCLKCNFPINNKPVYGLHKKCFSEWFSVQGNNFEFQNLIRKTSNITNDNDNFSYISSLFQGKFRKYTAALDNTEYIFKVQEKEFPELPLSEFLCNKTASQLKLQIADYYLINFHDEITFVSRNFLPDYGVSHLIHIYHFIKKQVAFNVENLTEIIKNETGRIKDIERFLELCLFDSFIGNHDRHGRNLALIETRKGRVLAPFYDNPGYLGIEEPSFLTAHHSPRGKIYTKKSNEPTLADYVEEIYRLGYKEVVEKFRKKCKLDIILNIFIKSDLSNNRKNAFIKLLSERYKELK